MIWNNNTEEQFWHRILYTWIDIDIDIDNNININIDIGIILSQYFFAKTDWHPLNIYNQLQRYRDALYFTTCLSFLRY